MKVLAASPRDPDPREAAKDRQQGWSPVGQSWSCLPGQCPARGCTANPGFYFPGTTQVWKPVDVAAVSVVVLLEESDCR